MIKKLFHRIQNTGPENDSHEFRPILSEIESRPINPLGHAMFWLIIIIVFTAVVWLIFGRVDIVVSARGKVIPEGNIKIIQSLDTGVIRKICIKEGDFVKKNDVLMEIDPSTTEPELASLKVSLDQYELEIERLKSLADERNFNPNEKQYDQAVIHVQNETYRAAYQGLKNQLEAKQMELHETEEKMNAISASKRYAEQTLSAHLEKAERQKQVLDIIPKSEYEQTIDSIKKAESQIKELSCQWQELVHQKSRLNKELSYIKEKFKTETLTLLSQKQLEAAQINAKIQEITYRHHQQKIIAPVDGYIVNLETHTLGGVVTPAQKLISMVPIENKLMIQAFVMSADIGFVKNDMPVMLKIDAFDFQKYGLLKGCVTYVAKNSIEDEKQGTIYEVFIKPLEKQLRVEGKMETITPGMTVIAEIKVGKRRIIEFFIYPLIKYWGEGISVR